MPPKRRIKLNRQGLMELVLACAFLSLFTFALWSWQNKGGYVAAMETTTPEVELSLMPQILRHPAIMLSTVVTEFILLLAILLAIVPISWWLRADHLMAGDNARVMTPLRWLGEKLHIVHAPTPPVQGDYVMNDAGELVFVPESVINKEGNSDQPDVVMVEQPDGTVVAMVEQADGKMVPVDTQATEGAGESTAPLVPSPGQTNDILNFEEEEDPLADLADIGDILSSAFDDESAIDPEREALSRELDEIDIMALLKDARNVLATFRQ